MTRYKRRGGRALLQDLRPGINIDSQVASCRLWIAGGLHGAKGSFHSYVLAVLANAGVTSDPPGEESERRDSEDSYEDDHADHDQNGLQSGSARRWGGSGWGRRRRRTRASDDRGRNPRSRRRSEYGCATFVTEQGSGNDARTTRIAERHGPPLRMPRSRTVGASISQIGRERVGLRLPAAATQKFRSKAASHRLTWSSPATGTGKT